MAQHKPRVFFHMLPEDERIWGRFLEHFEDQFTLYEYDVLVGPKLDVSSMDLPESLRDLAERLFCLRIDVVAHRPGEVWVIEVKPNAGLSALGQVLAYEQFLRPRLPSTVSLHKAVVTDFIRHYMPELFGRWDIWCLAVTEDGQVGLLPPRGKEVGPPFVEVPPEFIVREEDIVWPSGQPS